MSAGASEEFGPYAVYEEIGVGGMASIHRAETRGIEGFRKPVALKRMLPSYAANDEFVEAFIREARIASHLRHVNVAQTYELGKVGDVYFIAMELVTGRNLRQILRHCATVGSRMPVAVAVNILNQICDALDYAHNLCDETGTRLGIIHRDVSPSNIIVSEDGVVKLIDFGIAKASAKGMNTVSGLLKGKFGYMAPEYVAGSIDARADLFAVGVIAHELLTNRPLFTSNDDMETLHRVMRMPVQPPSAQNAKVPREIDDLVMTALERDPDRRWQHATALRTAMTTMTKRLQLDVMNTQVSEWIEWVFDQGKRDMIESTVQDSTDVDRSEPPTTSIEAASARTSVREMSRASGLATAQHASAPRDTQPTAAQAYEHDEPPETQTLLDLNEPEMVTEPDRPAPLARRGPHARTLLHGPERMQRLEPSPAQPLATARHAAVPAVRGSDPNVLRAPSRPSSPPATTQFGHGSIPPGGVAPSFGSGEATRVVAPQPQAQLQPQPRPQPRKGRLRWVLLLLLVFVVTAAATAVLYFAKS